MSFVTAVAAGPGGMFAFRIKSGTRYDGGAELALRGQRGTRDIK